MPEPTSPSTAPRTAPLEGEERLIARAREGELLHCFDPVRYPRPSDLPTAGQFRGIPVSAT